MKQNTLVGKGKPNINTKYFKLDKILQTFLKLLN